MGVGVRLRSAMKWQPLSHTCGSLKKVGWVFSFLVFSEKIRGVTFSWGYQINKWNKIKAQNSPPGGHNTAKCNFSNHDNFCCSGQISVNVLRSYRKSSSFSTLAFKRSCSSSSSSRCLSLLRITSYVSKIATNWYPTVFPTWAQEERRHADLNVWKFAVC